MRDQAKWAVEYSADPVYRFRLELNDGGSISLPYIGLLMTKGQMHKDKVVEIHLHHSQGLIKIEGQNLENLLDQLDRESVTAMRTGFSEDDSGPKIKSLVFEES